MAEAVSAHRQPCASGLRAQALITVDPTQPKGRFRRRNYAVAVLCSLFACAHASPWYGFQVYGIEQGLGNLSVSSSLQDRAGFIWIGTQNGLYRYEGGSFRLIGASEGMEGSSISDLKESSDGTLWVATTNGLFRKTGDRFEKVRSFGRFPLATGDLLAVGPGDMIYAITAAGLVGAYAPASAKIEEMKFRMLAEVSAWKTRAVMADRRGTVWFACEEGLCRFDSGHVQSYGPAEGVPKGLWAKMLIDNSSTLWVRDQDRLLRKSRGEERFSLVLSNLGGNTMSSTLALDAAGRLLVPSSRGLYRFDGSRWDLLDALGIRQNDVITILCDREGSIWLGSVGKGMARWLGYGEWEGWTQAEGLSGDVECGGGWC